MTTQVDAPVEVIPERADTGKAPGTQGSPVIRGLRYGLLVLFALIVMIPLYVLIVTSFKLNADFSFADAWNLPKRWGVQGWKDAWDALSAPLGRSLLMASVALLSSILGSMNGFVFAKWKFPGATTVFTLFLFGMFIPYQAIMIPLQGMFIELQKQPGMGWLDGIAKLIVVHTIFGIPICTLIFRNYYATAVPSEILEAAKVDGAGMLRCSRSPSATYAAFLFALFLTNRNNGPVTFALNELAGGQNPNYPGIMAGVLFASLPTLLVYIFLGRYFIGGLMSGSVK